MSNQNITIYDTTLRDGSQAEGVSFTVSAKLRVAQKLDQFGIDYIEGGWPGAPGARVRAATDAEVLVLARPLDEVLCADAALGAWLLRALAAAVADRELSVAIALEPRLERRLILKLRQLADRWGKVTPEGVRLDLRVTHQELADMIGGARESVTVALGRLQDQGEVIVRRRTVILRRMDDQGRVATETA